MNRREFIKIGTGFCLCLTPCARLVAEKMITAQTGFVSDSIFLEHDFGLDHPESPARLQTILKFIRNVDWYENLYLPDSPASVYPAIYAIHTQDHIDLIKKNYGRSHDVALAVVQGVLSAVDAVCQGKIRNAFCATRPPGHHARNTGREEGFCFYNAVAVAARYAQSRYKLEKILIVDWDYHHGNGTEESFYSDPGVLFFSTHDFYAYPGTGDPARQGAGAGYGYNINVHLDCGVTDTGIISAFEDILVPAARKFKPDLILISAGFDSREHDLLGCFNVTNAGFARLTRIVMALADEFCDGRIVSVLEGGYNLEGNASAVVEHVKTLTNI